MTVDDQTISTLAANTTMSPRTARYFLVLLASWQQKEQLTAAQAADIQKAAIDGAAVVGTSPVNILFDLYECFKGYAKEDEA